MATPMSEQQPDFNPEGQQEEQSRIEAMRQRASEGAGRLIARAHVRASGIRANLEERRLNHAINTMEKMDHKEALYEHMGQKAQLEISDIHPSDTVVHRDKFSRPPTTRTKPEERSSSEIFAATETAHKDKELYEKMGGRNKLFYDVEKAPRKKIGLGPKRRETTREKLKRTTDFVDGKEDKLKSKLPSPESAYHRKLRRKAISSELKRIKTVEQPKRKTWRVGSEKRRATTITDSENPHAVGRKTTSLDGDRFSRRGRAVARIKKSFYETPKYRERHEQLKAELEQRRQNN